MIPRFPRVLTLDTLGDDYGGGCVVTEAEHAVDYYNRVHASPRFHMIVRPRTDHVSDVALALARRARNICFVVEEADRYCSPSNIHPDLDHLVRYGRHQAVSLLVVSRRPAEIHRNITSAADLFVVHRTVEPRDLKYLKDAGAYSPDIPTLPTFEYRAFNKGGSTVLHRRPPLSERTHTCPAI